MPSLIGIVDSQIHQKHVVSHQTNKIGGLPDWPTKDVGVSLKCPVCCQELSLVVQIYCPLAGSHYHRTLYVFGCSNPSCWNRNESWIAVRCQVLDQESSQFAEAKAPTAGPDDDWGTGGDDWGADADDWGDDGGGFTDSKDDTATTVVTEEKPKELVMSDIAEAGHTLTSEDNMNNEASGHSTENGDNTPDNLPLQQMCLEDVADDVADDVGDDVGDDDSMSDPGSHVLVEDLPSGVQERRDETLKAIVADTGRPGDMDKVLVPFYMNVFEEPAGQSEDDKHVNKLLRDYQRQEGIQCFEESLSGGKGGGGGEKYEKTSVVHADAVFYKFMKKVSVCPEQCVRYEWGGSPLYIRPASKDVPSRCEHCGGRLVYEAQLMPALVNSLSFPHHKGATLEFGTVIVFSCEQSCWADIDTYRTERLVVQADPDHEKFKV